MINSHGGRRKREKKENVYILYERYNELTNWFYRRRRVSFSTRLFRVYSEFNVIPLPLDFQASLSVPLGNLSFNDDANIISTYIAVQISFKFSKLLLLFARYSPADNFSRNYYTQRVEITEFPFEA